MLTSSLFVTKEAGAFNRHRRYHAGDHRHRARYHPPDAFYEDVKDMPLGEILANHTGVSVYIQHDISAWTMAESLFGASRGARDVFRW